MKSHDPNPCKHPPMRERLLRTEPEPNYPEGRIDTVRCDRCGETARVLSYRNGQAWTFRVEVLR